MRPAAPGGIHLLNGFVRREARSCAGGRHCRSDGSIGDGCTYQQEVDLHTLFKDVASQYSEVVTMAEQLPNVLNRAIRIASSQRTVTAVIVPSDLQEEEHTPPTRAFKMVSSSLDQT